MKKLVLICVLLSGWASLPGVQMTDAERKACEAEGCSVWRAELEQLVRAAMLKGYQAGKGSL